MQVVLRIRPPKKGKEIELEEKIIKQTMIRNIYKPPTSTKEIYNKTCSNIVSGLFLGYCACILAYGQTSSGKTFTMYGTCKIPGIIRLIVSDIFETKNKYSSGWDISIKISFVEIYNERVYDLLDITKANLKVMLNKKKQFIIKGCTLKNVKSKKDVIALLNKGSKRRQVASTNYNTQSSRSHSIFRIYIFSTNNRLKIKRASHIDLVDLAGSESADKSGSTARIKEMKSINTSLLALTTIIKSLSNNSSQKKNWLFRNSILTKLLKDSLSGKSKVIIICTLTPHKNDSHENKNTISFANHAKTINIKPTANQHIIGDNTDRNNIDVSICNKQTISDDLMKKWKDEISRYEDEINSLKGEIKKMNVVPTPSDDYTLILQRRELNRRLIFG
jgi:centromeric protein E